MQSFRLSSAVASSALESIFFDRARLNRFIHSFTPMEASSTTAAMAENSTAVGWRIFSAEVLTSSTPMTRISTATPRPLRYSARAWP